MVVYNTPYEVSILTDVIGFNVASNENVVQGQPATFEITFISPTYNYADGTVLFKFLDKDIVVGSQNPQLPFVTLGVGNVTQMNNAMYEMLIRTPYFNDFDITKNSNLSLIAVGKRKIYQNWVFSQGLSDFSIVASNGVAAFIPNSRIAYQVLNFQDKSITNVEYADCWYDGGVMSSKTDLSAWYENRLVSSFPFINNVFPNLERNNTNFIKTKIKVWLEIDNVQIGAAFITDTFDVLGCQFRDTELSLIPYLDTAIVFDPDARVKFLTDAPRSIQMPLNGVYYLPIYLGKEKSEEFTFRIVYQFYDVNNNATASMGYYIAYAFGLYHIGAGLYNLGGRPTNDTVCYDVQIWKNEESWSEIFHFNIDDLMCSDVEIYFKEQKGGFATLWFDEIREIDNDIDFEIVNLQHFNTGNGINEGGKRKIVKNISQKFYVEFESTEKEYFEFYEQFLSSDTHILRIPQNDVTYSQKRDIILIGTESKIVDGTLKFKAYFEYDAIMAKNDITYG